MFSMRDSASESPDRSKLSIAATTASDFLAFASLAASAASPHCYKVGELPTDADAFTLSA